MELSDLSRTRLDYRRLPGGDGIEAILTVTLPNGRMKRYRRSWHAKKLGAVATHAPIVGAFGHGIAARAADEEKWRAANLKPCPGGRNGDELNGKMIRRTLSNPKWANDPKNRNWIANAKRHGIWDSDRLLGQYYCAQVKWSKPHYTGAALAKAIVEYAAPQLLNLVVPGAGVAVAAAIAAAEALSKGDTKAAFSAATKAAQQMGTDLPTEDNADAILDSLNQTKSALQDAAKNAPTAAKHALAHGVMGEAATDLAHEAKSLTGIDKAANVATAGVLGVASKLGAAQQRHDLGDKKGAQRMVADATLDARTLTQSADTAAHLLQLANDKRLGASAIASGKPIPRPTAPRTRGAKVDVLAAARAGALRSNKPGSVSADELLQAAKQGRVFWLS